MSDTPNDFDPSISQITGQAAHLMWLQRQLVVQRKNERMMLIIFGLSIVFDIVVLFSMLTLLREPLNLPDVVIGVTVVGLFLEMLVIGYATTRTRQRRRELEQEIDLLTKGYTQS